MIGKKNRFFQILLCLCMILFVGSSCLLTPEAKKSKKPKKKVTQTVMKGQLTSPESIMLGNNVTVYSSYMYTNYELKLLTCIIEAEAGNQPYKGKVAVGNVVLNRVDSPYQPNSIKGVIYAPNQFQPVSNGAFARYLKSYNKDSAMLRSCQKAAKAALDGVNYVGDRDGFCTPAAFESLNSRYAEEGSVLKIGGHVFYKNKR